MDYKEKRDLLKSEYFHLQTTVENFDSKILTFKAWSVTLAIAAFGFFGKEGIMEFVNVKTVYVKIYICNFSSTNLAKEKSPLF